MVGWKLEVGKMAMYMMFPVTLFHWFNQPEYFEKWVTKMKREMYPPSHLDHHEEIQQAIQSMRTKQQEKYLQMMEGTQKKD